MAKTKKDPTAKIIKGLKKLSEARTQYAVIEDDWAQKKATFEKKYEGVREVLQARADEVMRLDRYVRELCIEAYEESGLVNPGPGIQVRMIKELVCPDQNRAQEWAVQNVPGLLYLKDSTLKTLTIAGLVPVDIATMQDVPSVAIPRALDKALEGV